MVVTFVSVFYARIVRRKKKTDQGRLARSQTDSVSLTNLTLHNDNARSLHVL